MAKTIPVFLLQEPFEQYEKAKQYDTIRGAVQVRRWPVCSWGRVESSDWSTSDQRSLKGYSPWRYQELDPTELLILLFSKSEQNFIDKCNHILIEHSTVTTIAANKLMDIFDVQNHNSHS